MNPLVFENRDFQDGATAQDSKNIAQTKFDQWFNGLGPQEQVFGYLHADGNFRYSTFESETDTHKATLIEKSLTNLRQYDPALVLEKYDRDGKVKYFTQDGIPVKPLVFEEVKSSPKDSGGKDNGGKV